MRLITRSRPARCLLAAAAATLGLAPAPAAAATGWTVTPGGMFTGSGSVHVAGITCSSMLSGRFKHGSGLSGRHLATITNWVFTSCTGGFTLAGHGFPWYLNATSYHAGVTTGTLTSIDLVITGTGCSATVDGTAAGADNGQEGFTYTTSTSTLTLTDHGNLHAWAVSGCLGLIGDGDPEPFTGSLRITPHQAITSP